MKRSFTIASLLLAGLGCGKAAPPVTTPAPLSSAPEVAAPAVVEVAAKVEDAAAPDVAVADVAVEEAKVADVAVTATDVAVAATDVAIATADVTAPTEVVFAIDAGPKATKFVEVGKLATAKGDAKVLDALCAAEKKAFAGADMGPKCAVRELPGVAAQAIKGAAIIDVGIDDIPNPNQRIALAIDGPDGWKQVAFLGDGEVGMMGTRTYDHADIIGYGSYDFGALGGWMWVDVIQLRSSIQTGTHWDRTLWLCGGVGSVACHAVPVKYWYTPMLDGEMSEGPDSAPRPMFALAATLAKDGTLTLASKIDKVPPDIAKRLGSFKLDALN